MIVTCAGCLRGGSAFPLRRTMTAAVPYSSGLQPSHRGDAGTLAQPRRRARRIDSASVAP
jgi:hypothetical protein